MRQTTQGEEMELINDDMNIKALVSDRYESDDLNELFAALAKAQSEMEVAKTDNANPFYKSKYADLTAIVKASRPALVKNGLCIIQRISMNGDGRMYLLTRLAHSSGQWIESKMAINPSKTDVQSIGSYITYLRRYTYAAIAGVTVSDENDDDGESAMPRNGNGNTKITEYEVRELKNLLLQLKPDEEGKVLSWAQVSRLEDLTKVKYDTVKRTLTAKMRDDEKY